MAISALNGQVFGPDFMPFIITQIKLRKQNEVSLQFNICCKLLDKHKSILIHHLFTNKNLNQSIEWKCIAHNVKVHLCK